MQQFRLTGIIHKGVRTLLLLQKLGWVWKELNQVGRSQHNSCSPVGLANLSDLSSLFLFVTNLQNHLFPCRPWCNHTKSSQFDTTSCSVAACARRKDIPKSEALLKKKNRWTRLFKKERPGCDRELEPCFQADSQSVTQLLKPDRALLMDLSLCDGAVAASFFFFFPFSSAGWHPIRFHPIFGLPFYVGQFNLKELIKEAGGKFSVSSRDGGGGVGGVGLTESWCSQMMTSDDWSQWPHVALTRETIQVLEFLG